MNKVILMGRLGKDPELRYTQNNTAVCGFSLAVDNGYGEKKTTSWINCQAWQKTAEFISKYFQKGSMIAVVGRIQTRTWEDKEGKKHYVTEVVVEETYFTGSKNQTETYKPEDTFPPDDDDELPF